jgi:hypothetical protein
MSCSGIRRAIRREASDKTYKMLMTSTGNPITVLFLHLSFCDLLFSSPPNFALLKSSFRTSSFRLLRIDMRNRLQKPCLRCGPIFPISYAESLPSSSDRNDTTD